MWKFRDNICGQQSNICFNFFWTVIDIEERKYRTKFQSYTMNITCFINDEVWKFRDNICGRQSNIFSKFFFIVIELHERNQPTKFYLGNINITCFIKVLRNSPQKNEIP